MKYKIIIDSCGEQTTEMKQDEKFMSVPLTLQVDDEQIIDDDTFDQISFLKKVAASPNCPKSACPSPDYYREAFDCEAEHIYCVTLSAALSGSYNSAQLGRSILMEEKPEKKIHVFNSRSASVGETLIALKIRECEEQNMEWDEIIACVDKYIEEENTWFVLENLETLRKNGRLSNLKAMVASALKIKPLMGATPEGTIIQLEQARGMNKALIKMVNDIAAKVKRPQEKTLAISHCNCPERAEMVKKALEEKITLRDIIILDTAGVSSMYANDGGIIVVV